MSGADGNAETVSRQWALSGLFDVLGVRALAGRTFLPPDDAERTRAIVLSEPFWRTRFGADPKVIGSQLRLDGDLWTVVGVGSERVRADGRDQHLGAAHVRADSRAARRSRLFFPPSGACAPGVSIEAARSDLSGIAEELAREFPETNAGRGVTLEALHDALVGSELKLTSMLFLGVVGFVLLDLLRQRRQPAPGARDGAARELAIRSALGADRRRVIRQLLTESLLLSALGGLLGVGVGALILGAAPSVIPQGLLPAAVRLDFDARVVGFCALVALVVGLLFGLAPAWQATRLSPRLR